MRSTETVDDVTEGLESAEIHLPATIAENEKRVERGFWKKLARVAARIPFTEDLVTAYYCARDRETPTRVRAVLLAALAYFVVPTDIVPDFIAVLGFTDDATVLATAVGIVSAHIKPQHRAAAVKAIAEIKGQDTPSS